MNGLATFDSHRSVKRLRLVGFSEEQAEALTEMVQNAVALDMSRLATKDQLAALGSATKDQLAALGSVTKDQLAALDIKLDTKIDQTAARLEERIERRGAETEARLMRWVISTGVAVVVTLGSMMAGGIGWVLHTLSTVGH